MPAGQSKFRKFQELLDEGFTPIPVTGPNVNVGMLKGKEMYVCFLADNEADSEDRQAKLLATVKDGAPVTEVPNIPLYCVKAE